MYLDAQFPKPFGSGYFHWWEWPDNFSLSPPVTPHHPPLAPSPPLPSHSDHPRHLAVIFFFFREVSVHYCEEPIIVDNEKEDSDSSNEADAQEKEGENPE